MSSRWRHFIEASLLIFLVLIACDSFSDLESETDQGTLVNLRISLVNDTALPLHLVAEDEQFGDSNRVAANNSRSYTARGVFDRQALSFRAGIFTELWVEVGHVTCTFDKSNYSASKDDYLVIYHGVGAMSCDNW